MENGPLFIIGAGGFGREVWWLAKRLKLSPQLLQTECIDVPEKSLSYGVYSLEAHQSVFKNSGFKPDYTVAVGDPTIRRHLVQPDWGLAATLVDPSAIIGCYPLKEGTIICAGTVMTVDIKVGRFTHINLGCRIGHDVEIGEFCTLSPSVNLMGNVKVGNGVFIGTGATVLPGVCLGDGVVLGAGAVANKDIAAGCTAVGVPAKVIKEAK